MNTLILTLLIQSWCGGYVENEYGHLLVWDEEQTNDYKSCIDETVESDLFDYSYFTSHPDVRI